MDATPDIVMYSSGWCPYCVRARALLAAAEPRLALESAEALAQRFPHQIAPLVLSGDLYLALEQAANAEIAFLQAQRIDRVGDAACDAFADLSIVAPSRHIPLIGSPTTLACLINFFVVELAARRAA